MERFTGTPQEWNALVAQQPGAQLLQSWEWGQLKARLGWQPLPVTWPGQAAALVLRRSIRLAGLLPLSMLYVPRGPLLDWDDTSLAQQVLADLQTLARQTGAIFIKMDAEIPLGRGVPQTPEAGEIPSGQAAVDWMQTHGWRFSGEQVQFRNTVLVDLSRSEEDLLAAMKQKTRYNVRLAERKGVQVRRGTPADLEMLYDMYAETSLRDGFVIRERGYYLDIWRTFMQKDMADPLIAEVEGVAIAAVMLFRFGGRAWYFYGMSRDLHRETMPNYLLQWEAMRHSKAAGCTVYDLWGAPDVFNEEDSMWGVFRFKEGLGGSVLRTPGAWDFPARPLLYRLYTEIWPRLVDRMRRRGKAKTRQEMEARNQ